MDRRSLVRMLLTPGSNETLTELRTRHLQGDLASLSAFAQERLDAEPDDIPAAALRVLEQCLDDVPACGGLHANSREGVIAAAVGCLCESALFDQHTGDVTVGARALDELALPRSGLTVVLPRPMDVTCRVSSDALTLHAEGGEVARVERADDGVLELRVAAPGVRTRQRCVVRNVPIEGGCLGSGSRLPPSAAVLDRSLSDEEKDHLDVAFGLLNAAAPGLYEELLAEKVRLVALQTRPGLTRQSCSFRSAPGLVFVNLSDPLEILDLVCHEYHHLKLFRVQETATLMHRPGVSVRAPWRADRRTSEGLLHGIYVFYMCAWLLDVLFRVFSESERGEMRRTVFRACIESGLDELERANAGLSPLGQLLFDTMAVGNAAAIDELAATSPTAIGWARSTVGEHMERVGSGAGREPWFLGL